MGLARRSATSVACVAEVKCCFELTQVGDLAGQHAGECGYVLCFNRLGARHACVRVSGAGGVGRAGLVRAGVCVCVCVC